MKLCPFSQLPCMKDECIAYRPFSEMPPRLTDLATLQTIIGRCEFMKINITDSEAGR